tara:strand:- start:597 stop:1313 length:717 start_codon:yes stop_codon:yes gene_type:complete
MDISDKIKVVLVETSHPGNIGSVARAMKTMGFKDLLLVDPKCEINSLSYAMASSAKDILKNSLISHNLTESLKDFDYVIGSSARRRGILIDFYSPKEVAEDIIRGNHKNICILLGNESRGLTNSQLSLCDSAIHIPANKNYCSLNIASALQIILYEILVLHSDASSNISNTQQTLATNDRFNGMIKHLENVLSDIRILENDKPTLRNKINYIFKKAKLTDEEINIVRGVLTAIEKHLR